MATCACKQDHDGKVECLCGRRLKVALAPSTGKCQPRKLTVELWSDARTSIVAASTNDTLTLIDGSAFAVGASRLTAVVGGRIRQGAYASRSGNVLSGVTGLANLPPGTTITSPPGLVDDFSGPATLTVTGGWILPTALTLTAGRGEVDLAMSGNATLNITAKVVVPDEDVPEGVTFTGSVTASVPGGCSENCACCCTRLELVISGFTGTCGGNLNGTVYFDFGGNCAYSLDMNAPGRPSGITGGVLTCTDCAWELILYCPQAGGHVVGVRPRCDEPCPPRDDQWTLHATPECGGDCGGQTGHGSLSCTYEYVPVWRDCLWEVAAEHPCYGQCSCLPTGFEVLLDGLTICTDFCYPWWYGTRLKVASFNGVLDVLHCLQYNPDLSGCHFTKVIPAGVTFNVYEDGEGEPCSNFAYTMDIDVCLRLQVGGGNVALVVWLPDLGGSGFTASTVSIFNYADGPLGCDRVATINNGITECGYGLSPGQNYFNIAYGGVAVVTPCCS